MKRAEVVLVVSCLVKQVGESSVRHHNIRREECCGCTLRQLSCTEREDTPCSCLRRSLREPRSIPGQPARCLRSSESAHIIRLANGLVSVGPESKIRGAVAYLDNWCRCSGSLFRGATSCLSTCRALRLCFESRSSRYFSSASKHSISYRKA